MDQHLLNLVPIRRGHFRYESGYHGDLWLDLEALFLRPAGLQPFIDARAQQLSLHDIEAVCGPLTGGAFVAQMVARTLGSEFYFTQRVESPNEYANGPATYRLPNAVRPLVRGKRIAIVDDAINAGSAIAGTLTELRDAGATPIAVGTLLVLGDASAKLLAANRLPLERIAAVPSALWLRADCPLCANGVSLMTV